LYSTADGRISTADTLERNRFKDSAPTSTMGYTRGRRWNWTGVSIIRWSIIRTTRVRRTAAMVEIRVAIAGRPMYRSLNRRILPSARSPGFVPLVCYNFQIVRRFIVNGLVFGRIWRSKWVFKERILEHTMRMFFLVIAREEVKGVIYHLK